MDNRFQKLRLTEGIGQRELCRRFGEGFYNPHICELESGKRQPTLKDLKAYHDYFHVSFEYLLGETDTWREEEKESHLKSDHVFYKLSLSEDPYDRMIYQVLDDMLCTHSGLFLLESLAQYLYAYEPQKEQQYKGVINKSKKIACSADELKRIENRLLNIIEYIKKHKTENMLYNELQMLFDEKEGE